jgi:amino acid transporter
MTPSKTVCPGCGQSVEFVTTPEGRRHCPQCGAPFAELIARSRINWFVFLLVLLAPALLAALGAQIKSDDLAVGGVFAGSPVAGIFCGVLMGRRFGRTTGSRIVLGIVFTIVFGAVSFVLSCFGCSLGGFNLKIH